MSKNQYEQMSLFDICADFIDEGNEIIPEIVQGSVSGGKVEASEIDINEIEQVNNNDSLLSRDDSDVELSLNWDEVFSDGIDMPVAEKTVDSEGNEVVTLIPISDALIYSLTNKGRVDMNYMCEITGEKAEIIADTLYGSIYQDPMLWDEGDIHTGWVTADEYLSGNLSSKLRAIYCINNIQRRYPHLLKNIAAIKEVIPTYLPAEDIYVTLGSPWIPVHVIEEFVSHILNTNKRSYSYMQVCPDITHDEVTSTWYISNKSRYKYLVGVSDVYGTRRMNALEIIERCLNMKTVAVYDTVKTTTTKSGTKKVLNKIDTLAAQDKQKKLMDEFQKFIKSNNEIREELEEIFWRQFGTVRRRSFDGSFLTFPGMTPDFNLYQYQKNAVARIIFSKNTLLAHDVGAGKTYVMIAAGMELKRMGLSKKNLYVVPNNIVGQWEAIFKELYPDARILVVNSKNFTKEKRQGVLRDIHNSDYDGIIMAYSCFDMIPVSDNYKREDLMGQVERLRKSITDRKKSTPAAGNKYTRLKDKLSEISVVKSVYLGLCFDELGIDRLFVDEAHNYKNVPIETKIDNVLGISSSGSAKCVGMLEKVHYMQKTHGGGGVVFATGTPITNSITDAYVMQYYLQSGELAMIDLEHFDSWVGMFAEKTTEFEIDVDTSNYRLATRFSKFHNLPELATLLSSVADFHQVDKSDGIPENKGYQDVTIEKSEILAKYLMKITTRAEIVRSGRIPRTEDNMLKITTDGRKAALDVRLVEPDLQYSYDSKVAKCAARVYSIYNQTTPNKSTQLIFCDTSTPKEGFNIYDDLRKRLVLYGVPIEDIAYIHEATTEAKRNALYDKMRNGELRILIGSTAKLGLGVNVQDKLIALHHLDVPWRPADMTQREGRILRQGNENKQVFIYRYITKGSFDAYSWQLLETKQGFISGLLSGFMKDRSGSNIEDTVLNYAEVKALAIGNPLIKERVHVANELSRYKLLQKNLLESRESMNRELSDIGVRIEKVKDWMEKCSKDFGYYEANKTEKTFEEKQELGAEITAAIKDNEFKEVDTEFTNYQGFTVILPAHMDGVKPFIYIRNNGNYRLDMGLSEVGNMTRIDNLLNGFEKRLDSYKKQYKELVSRRVGLEAELKKEDDYSEMISSYEKRLKELDEQLGVNKK